MTQSGNNRLNSEKPSKRLCRRKEPMQESDGLVINPQRVKFLISLFCQWTGNQ